MIAFMICTTIVGMYRFPDKSEAYDVCEMVVWEAEAQGVDPTLVVALAFHESGLRRFVVSRVGAIGPLQVMPRYYPKDVPRNTRGQIKAGVQILKLRLKKSRDVIRAVAMYNGGNKPGERSFRWARSVMRLSKKLGGE